MDVTGTVTSAENDEPIGGVSVEVLRADNGNTLASATTDTTGSYEATFTIEEPSAPDQIRLELSAEGFVDKEVSTGFQPSVTEDVTLEAMSVEATASGTVTDSDTGDPIEGASVTGTRPGGGEQLFEATTSSDGTYEATFEVADEPNEVAIQADAQGFEAADTTVSFSEQISADLGLQVATTQATASGTVTNEDTGDPIEGATVTGTRPDGGDQLFQATTTSDGTYEATFGVADEPSEITVQAEAENFDSGERSASFGEQITADVSLQPATIEATASGTVSRSDTGDPVEGATVTATRPDTGKQLFETTTSSDGSYQGSFEMKATNEPSDVDFAVSAGDFKSGGATVAFAKEIARDFQLEPKTTEATVSGTVTRSDNGDPIDGATVTGSPAGGSEKLFETTTNASGEYETTFEAKAPDKPDQVAVGANSGDFDGSEQTVGFGNEISVDLSLSPSEVNVVVSGTITAELDDSTVEGAEVSIFRAGENSGEALGSTTSEMGGAYEVSFSTLAPDAPDELRIEAKENRFADASLTVGFSESVSRDVALPSIEISTVDELQAIQTNQDFPLDGFYVQTADIDASATANWNGGKGLSPIGDDVISFTGTYDGNGFTIEKLTIDRSDENEVGLFGHMERDGIIQDVTLVNASVSGSINTGGIVGESKGELLNSKYNGNVASGSVVGGLIGRNDEGRVYGSVAEGSIIGDRNVAGGLVGRNTGEVQNSVASSSVEGGDSNIGGLVGINSEGEIGNSEATGDVTGGSEVGGLVGQNEAGTVNSSTAKGTVEGNNRVGGLVGYNSETRNEGGTVVTSYGTGSVSGDEGVGALVGVNSGDSDITESYAVGTVSGNRDTGGLIGVNGASISSSYWDTETTGQSDGVGRGSPDGTTGLTTSEMQGNSAEENMDGFDFQNTWRVVMGDYPALQWEE
ncbi:hypothetical protein GGQ01_002316 [Salinibacter ruber]|uniref:GLUG domain-containing protein n=1 Tax=Salinibacter ruber TaxID=146919 RepID=A0A9X2ULU7_9BACT|nr:hypothetical protein [Salinibacter ruber]